MSAGVKGFESGGSSNARTVATNAAQTTMEPLIYSSGAWDICPC